VADVLFGKVNPSARLPVSFPHESGQEPFFYNHRTTGRPAPQADDSQEYKARWRTIRNEALYPFGHGLSYTSFALSDVKLSTTRLGWNDKLFVTATVPTPARSPASTSSSSTSATGWPAARGRCASSSASSAWR
jgi:beta-glucosidase